MTTTPVPELDTLAGLIAALVKLAADIRSLAATIRKAADAAAGIDPQTFSFCHRLMTLLTDLSHQLSSLELPKQFRAAH
jgi:hypothetical protein